MRLGISALLLLISVKLFSQFALYSNEFLKIGATAQMIAMGNSNFTLVNDASATFINPTKLLDLEQNFNLTYTYSQIFNNLANYQFISYATKKENLALGIGFVRLEVDNIPNTLNISYNTGFDLSQISYFTISDNALIIALAFKREKFNLAISNKLIYRNLYKFAKGFGFGIDVFVSKQLNNWNLAFIAQDINTTFTFWSITLDSNAIAILQATNNQIPKNTIELTPPSFIVAVGRQYKFKSLKLFSELSLLIYPTGRSNYLISTPIVSISPQFGTEIEYKNLYLRFGMNNFQRIEYFTDSLNTQTFINIYPHIGIGFKYRSLSIDYAIQNFLNQKAVFSSQFFTIKFQRNVSLNRRKTF